MREDDDLWWDLKVGITVIVLMIGIIFGICLSIDEQSRSLKGDSLPPTKVSDQ